MAKAKKQEPKAKKAADSDKKKAPAAAKKKGAAPPSGGQSSALIDTSLAAEAAAKMIASRSGEPSRQQSGNADAVEEQGGEKRETSAFKQMKQSLSKPTSQGLGGLLGGAGGSRKSNQPFGGGKQVARNQTFGADVNRSGVPRRTGG